MYYISSTHVFMLGVRVVLYRQSLHRIISPGMSSGLPSGKGGILGVGRMQRTLSVQVGRITVYDCMYS